MKIYIMLFVINTVLSITILTMIFRAIYLWSTLKFMGKTGVPIDMNKIFPRVINQLWIWLIKYPLELDKTHLSQEDKLVFHLIWSMLIPVLCIVGSIRQTALIKIFLFVFISSIVIRKMLLISFRKQRVMIFNKNAYRLYKFLHNQLSAGVQPKECMASLHRIVQEPFLKKRLKALGSMYSQTLDFNIAFKEVSEYYGGTDVDAFKIAIQQGLEMGDNLNTIEKQESLMFSKYMNYLQLETNREKIKTLLIVTIFCAIIIFMVGLPLLMELDEAIQLLFI